MLNGRVSQRDRRRAARCCSLASSSKLIPRSLNARSTSLRVSGLAHADCTASRLANMLRTARPEYSVQFDHLKLLAIGIQDHILVCPITSTSPPSM